MASTAFVLMPIAVLAAAWSLLTAFDERSRPRAVAGAWLLVAAVVLTAVGIALDHQSPAPPRTHGTTTAGV